MLFGKNPRRDNYHNYQNNSNQQNNQNVMGWGRMFGRSHSGGYNNSNPAPRDDRPRIADGVKLFHGPMRFKFFGFNVFVSTGKQVGFIATFVMMVVMAFSLFATFSAVSYNNNKIAEYETEIVNIQTLSDLYLDIIEKANSEEEGYGITTGTFSGQQIQVNSSGIHGIYRFNSDSYYIKYKVVFSEKPYWFDTFAIYTSIDNIKNKYTIAQGSLSGNDYVFQVAYKLGENGLIEYAVNTDYDATVNYNIVAYQNKIASCEQSLKISKISAGILIGIAVLIIALFVLLIVKVVKRSIRQNRIERAKEEAELQELQARAEQAKEEINRKHRYCEYCGAKFNENDDKCPNCGSVHYDIRR